jgi:hypothetical protein
VQLGIYQREKSEEERKFPCEGETLQLKLMRFVVCHREESQLVYLLYSVVSVVMSGERDVCMNDREISV